MKKIFGLFSKDKKAKNFQYEDITTNHLEFLNFINKKEITPHIQSVWGNILKEDILNTLDNFMSIEYINEASGTQKLNLIPIATLKEILSLRDITFLDNREDIVKCITSNFTNEEIENMTQINNIYILTEKGQNHLNEHLAFKNKEISNLEKQVYHFIEMDKLVSAGEAISDFESNRLFPRYTGFDWKDGYPLPFLETTNNILKLNFENFNNSEEYKTKFKYTLAMGYMLGENSFKIAKRIEGLGESFRCTDCMNVVVYLDTKLNKALNKTKLHELKEDKDVQNIKIITTNNIICNHSDDIKRVYSKEEFNNIPQVPFDYGCKCSYEAVYTK